jgi:hypothetical protein
MSPVMFTGKELGLGFIQNQGIGISSVHYCNKYTCEENDEFKERLLSTLVTLSNSL